MGSLMPRLVERTVCVQKESAVDQRDLEDSLEGLETTETSLTGEEAEAE